MKRWIGMGIAIVGWIWAQPAWPADFEVALHMVSDNSNTNNAQCTAFSGLYSFPIYLQLTIPAVNFTSWGVAVYTDNKSPEQTGVTINTPDGRYGGLFDSGTLSKRMPLYWQVYNAIQRSGTGLDFPSTVGWGLVMDRSDTDVNIQWNERDIIERRTIASYQSLAFYPPRGREAVNPIFYLYLAADFRGALPAERYLTSLNVDFYNFDINICSGGFATPNPFTPARGQRTNFNFFVSQFGAPFAIKIYTIRGRLIRTITDSREWDGRNDQGGLAEGGLYIYQIEAEGRRVSGTVVLIK